MVHNPLPWWQQTSYFFVLADTNTTYNPSIRTNDDHLHLMLENPVAGACFFHLMVNAFIEHVLGVDDMKSGININHGLFGKTSTYYGIAEQHGRLTLHFHMALWVRKSLTSQEIRNRIMDEDSTFQQKMVQYLEGVHMGEFWLVYTKTLVKE